jgi:hypothetical protein
VKQMTRHPLSCGSRITRWPFQAAIAAPSEGSILGSGASSERSRRNGTGGVNLDTLVSHQVLHEL